MIRFSFKKGLQFRCGKQIWTLLSRTVTGKFLFENDIGEKMAEEPSVIHQKWLNNEWKIEEESIGGGNVLYFATPRDLSIYTEHHQAIARYRQTYIERLEEKRAIWSFGSLPPLINEVASELSDCSPPSARTILRWYSRYRRSLSITALVPRSERAGRKSSKDLYEYFLDVVNTVYLTKQKRPKKHVYETLKLKIHRINETEKPDGEKLEPPSSATVYRWLNTLQRDIVDRARLGKDTAEMKYRQSIKTIKVEYILDRVEVDHTPLDVIVIDTLTKLPCGRPWLTLAIDKKSRMIIGFYISFHAPSSFSVMQCLKRAVLPKDTWLSKFEGINSDWPAHGIPHSVAWDNGMDFHAEAVRKQCQEMGIGSIDFCPRKMPTWKASIERAMRTIGEGLIHLLPGTTFSNINQRGEYNAAKYACIDLQDLVYLVTKWIVDIYHHTPHREIGTTPYKKWKRGLADRIIELPAYPDQLEIMVGIPVTKKLWHYGFELEGLFYNSEHIQELRRFSDKTPEILIKYHEDTIEYIQAFDPRIDEYVRVDVCERKLEYAKDLHRQVHRMVRAKIRAENKDPDDAIALLEAKEEIQKVIDAAVRDKRMGTRKKVKALLQSDSESIIAEREDTLTKITKSVITAKVLQKPSLHSGLDDDLPSYVTKKSA